MSQRRRERGPVVIDTGVFGADLVPGSPLTLKLRSELARAEVVWAGPELVETYAKLRVECEAAGHALAQRPHDADRWIAATAVRLGDPLVSHDSVFRNVPGLILEASKGDRPPLGMNVWPGRGPDRVSGRSDRFVFFFNPRGARMPWCS